MLRRAALRKHIPAVALRCVVPPYLAAWSSDPVEKARALAFTRCGVVSGLGTRVTCGPWAAARMPLCAFANKTDCSWSPNDILLNFVNPAAGQYMDAQGASECAMFARVVLAVGASYCSDTRDHQEAERFSIVQMPYVGELIAVAFGPNRMIGLHPL